MLSTIGCTQTYYDEDLYLRPLNLGFNIQFVLLVVNSLTGRVGYHLALVQWSCLVKRESF